MARDRAVKAGLDYFSHDVDLAQDKKIKLLKAKYGLIAYAIFLRLLEDVYNDKGYFLSVNEDTNLLFCDENKIDYNDYILILNDCIERDLFDKDMYEKYQILTSKRIQLNYLSGTERRKEVKLISEYLLVSVQDRVNVNIITLNVNILELNEDICQQSKVKESKVNKKDLCPEQNSAHDSTPPFIEMPLNNNSIYPIYENQVNEWVELYPNVDVKQHLRNMKGWLIANPKKRKTKSGILRFVSNWLSSEQNKGRIPPQINNPVQVGQNTVPLNFFGED